VGTVMTNFGLEQAMAGLSIPFVRAKVGDRHVHKGLVDGGGLLGGEASGHLLCLDRASTGDAIISALQVLEVLRAQGQTLRQALSGLVMVPQVTENVRLNGDAKAVVAAPAVLQALAAAELAVAGRGRAFLRPSGTEPVVRVTVEADTAELVRKTLDDLAAAVRQAAA
jgi:phosphoglucosamine mutase